MFCGRIIVKQSKGLELKNEQLFNKHKPAFQNLLFSWKNGNTELRRKRLILNCNILKTGSSRKYKFGENAF